MQHLPHLEPPGLGEATRGNGPLHHVQRLSQLQLGEADGEVTVEGTWGEGARNNGLGGHHERICVVVVAMMQ
jgi:hypothetical protein